MSTYLDDLLILLGCACIVYAAWRYNPTLAWLVGGVLSLGGGLFLAYAKSRSDK